MSDEMNIYCDASQDRYYLIPRRLVCADGPLLAYDLAGKATRVRAASLEPFEMAPKAVSSRLQMEVGRALAHAGAALVRLTRHEVAAGARDGEDEDLLLAAIAQGMEEWLPHLEGTAGGSARARCIEQAADTLLDRAAMGSANVDAPSPTEQYRHAARSGIARSLRAHGIPCLTGKEG